MQYLRFFVVFGCPDEEVEPFWKYIAVLPHPPYTKTKLGKNSGYTRPTLFLGVCDLKRAPKLQMCLKHFCPLLNSKKKTKKIPVKP